MGAGVNRRPKDLGLEAGGFAAGLEGGGFCALEGGGFSALDGGGFSAGFEGGGFAGEGEAAGGVLASSGFPSSAWTSASPSSSIATATTNVLFIPKVAPVNREKKIFTTVVGSRFLLYRLVKYIILGS
jgi:hypothetical protein